MIKFRMVCPDCGAVVITASPHALIWEPCPRCGKHLWDVYDQLMADRVQEAGVVWRAEHEIV